VWQYSEVEIFNKTGSTVHGISNKPASGKQGGSTLSINLRSWTSSPRWRWPCPLGNMLSEHQSSNPKQAANLKSWSELQIWKAKAHCEDAEISKASLQKPEAN
jgi:hypothetical protein